MNHAIFPYQNSYMSPQQLSRAVENSSSPSPYYQTNNSPDNSQSPLSLTLADFVIQCAAWRSDSITSLFNSKYRGQIVFIEGVVAGGDRETTFIRPYGWNNKNREQFIMLTGCDSGPSILFEPNKEVAVFGVFTEITRNNQLVFSYSSTFPQTNFIPFPLIHSFFSNSTFELPSTMFGHIWSKSRILLLGNVGDSFTKIVEGNTYFGRKFIPSESAATSTQFGIKSLHYEVILPSTNQQFVDIFQKLSSDLEYEFVAKPRSYAPVCQFELLSITYQPRLASSQPLPEEQKRQQTMFLPPPEPPKDFEQNQYRMGENKENSSTVTPQEDNAQQRMMKKDENIESKPAMFGLTNCPISEIHLSVPESLLVKGETIFWDRPLTSGQTYPASQPPTDPKQLSPYTQQAASFIPTQRAPSPPRSNPPPHPLPLPKTDPRHKFSQPPSIPAPSPPQADPGHLRPPNAPAPPRPGAPPQAAPPLPPSNPTGIWREIPPFFLEEQLKLMSTPRETSSYSSYNQEFPSQSNKLSPPTSDRVSDISTVLKNYQSQLSAQKENQLQMTTLQIEEIKQSLKTIQNSLTQTLKTIKTNISQLQTNIHPVTDTHTISNTLSTSLEKIGQELDDRVAQLAEQIHQSRNSQETLIQEKSQQFLTKFQTDFQTSENPQAIAQELADKVNLAYANIEQIGIGNRSHFHDKTSEMNSQIEAIRADIRKTTQLRSEAQHDIQTIVDRYRDSTATLIEESRTARFENENAILNMMELTCKKIEETLV
ncbi:hypothetical protein BLNAU_15969 [Blattamonas nauphoetae]|uniref:Uncharacterized protein n=1 Tax=Blattamonas nauphoetae TaxID=2049346 RepID=A0ABQ9XCY9_9EUKA|nr:hypothetical protein BLNAU_15969 [Blattamonas nauphoetae]